MVGLKGARGILKSKARKIKEGENRILRVHLGWIENSQREAPRGSMKR